MIHWHFREWRDKKNWRRKFFKGNTERTYRNVSALREHLLGSWRLLKIWDGLPILKHKIKNLNNFNKLQQ